MEEYMKENFLLCLMCILRCVLLLVVFVNCCSCLCVLLQLSCLYCCSCLVCTVVAVFVYCCSCLVCIVVAVFVYCCSCLVCIVVVVLCVLLQLSLCIAVVVLCVLLQLSLCIVVILCVFAVLCVYCCFYFRCRTAGQKSVFGRSCDRPSRHRFFLVSLCLTSNAEMVPKIPSCHYMLLMQPSRLKFISKQFHILYTSKLTTAIG